MKNQGFGQVTQLYYFDLRSLYARFYQSFRYVLFNTKIKYVAEKMWNYLAENKYFIFIVFYFIHKSLSAYVIKYQSYPQSDPFLNSKSPANKKKLP